jgi:hypothetical protein
MLLDGLDITDDCSLELVNRLRRADFAHQADTIEGALVSGQSEVSLTIPDRVAILAVLDVRGASVVASAPGVPVADQGFAWMEAALGASSMLVLLCVLGGAGLLIARQRKPALQ